MLNCAVYIQTTKHLRKHFSHVKNHHVVETAHNTETQQTSERCLTRRPMISDGGRECCRCYGRRRCRSVSRRCKTTHLSHYKQSHHTTIQPGGYFHSVNASVRLSVFSRFQLKEGLVKIRVGSICTWNDGENIRSPKDQENKYIKRSAAAAGWDSCSKSMSHKIRYVTIR